MCRDPEPLLLVDHDQPEVLEPDVLRQQPMRADHDVDGPVLEPGDRRSLLLRGDEARQDPDLERERGEPLTERRVVLRGQHGRGHEHGHLLAVLRRLECRAQGDLGLAVPDVTDHQPVHRHGTLHVGLGLGSRAKLVDRLLVRERRLHLRLPRRVDREAVTVRVRSRGIEDQQLVGEFGDGFADALLGAQPFGTAELAE